jgi:hypothetical protein
LSMSWRGVRQSGSCCACKAYAGTRRVSQLPLLRHGRTSSTAVQLKFWRGGDAANSLPPCGGGPGWGVALTPRIVGPCEDSQRSARPPSLTLPHKGGGNFRALTSSPESLSAEAPSPSSGEHSGPFRGMQSSQPDSRGLVPAMTSGGSQYGATEELFFQSLGRNPPIEVAEENVRLREGKIAETARNGPQLCRKSLILTLSALQKFPAIGRFQRLSRRFPSLRRPLRRARRFAASKPPSGCRRDAPISA